MHEKTKKFTLAPDPIYTQIDNEIVVRSPINSDFYGISEVGSELWCLIESKSASLSDMVNHLKSIYDVDDAQAAQDIATFLDDMQAQGLIIEDSSLCSE